MRVGIRGAAGPCPPAAWSMVIGLIVGAGCGPGSMLDRAGIKLSVPDGWSVRPTSEAVVPGTPIASWSGPDGSSFTVLTSLPIPRPSAPAIAAELANRWSNLPGIRVDSTRTEPVGGLDAGVVDCVGDGTGGAFVPTGMGAPVSPSGRPLVRTRRVCVTIPRKADTITLLWHHPEASKAAADPAIAAILRSIRIDDVAVRSSSY